VSLEKLQQEMVPLIDANQALMTHSTAAIADWIKGKARIMKSCIADYNAMCEKKADDSFFKDPAFLVPFRKPPFFVFRSGLSLRHTQGALKVNPRMSVLMPYDNPVPYLMACGADIGGLYADLFVSSEDSRSIEWAIASGMGAGGNSAAYVNGMKPVQVFEFPKYSAREVMAGNFKNVGDVKGGPPGMKGAPPNEGEKSYH
jgi:hypothetical protein